MRRLASSTILTAAALVLVACGSSTIAQDDVEEQVSTQLTETVGQEPDAVDCPGDLTAEVGEEMTCVLTAGPDTIDVAVRVTEVSDGNAEFDIQVADEVN